MTGVTGDIAIETCQTRKTKTDVAIVEDTGIGRGTPAGESIVSVRGRGKDLIGTTAIAHGLRSPNGAGDLIVPPTHHHENHERHCHPRTNLTGETNKLSAETEERDRHPRSRSLTTSLLVFLRKKPTL